MTQNIKIYNLQDNKNNSFILITGEGCQCEVTSNSDKETKDDSANKQNTTTKFLPTTSIITNSIKSKSNKKKNKRNKKNKNKNINKIEESTNQINHENKKFNNLSQSDADKIFSKKDLEFSKSINLTLEQVNEFYLQMDMDKLGPYVPVNIVDKDIKLDEDKDKLMFKPIIETPYKSYVGWIKNQNQLRHSLCAVIKDFRDIIPLHKILSELTSSKKPENTSNIFELIITQEALNPYKNEILEQLKILLINLITSIMFNLASESVDSTQSPKVLIRGLAKIMSKSQNNKKKNNTKTNNPNDKDNNYFNESSDIINIFFNNSNDSANLLASAKRFKSEKNRRSADKAAKFINKDFFKSSNLLKGKILPFVEATSIIRTYDPITNNNLNANNFNSLLSSVPFIQYSSYIEFDQDGNIKTQDTKQNNINLVTVRLNSEFDSTDFKSNNNYSGSLRNIFNQEEDTKNSILFNKIIDKNLEISKLENNNSQEMGLSEISFD